jgi:hypothetical protein
MSVTTEVSAGIAASSSLADSTAFERFAIVCAVATPILYIVIEMANWPLFTYHPATGRIDLGWAPPIKDQGPAMYWYGWTATMLLGSFVFGLIGAVLPQSVIRKIPLSLVWILPLVAIPVLAYALRSFWRF